MVVGGDAFRRQQRNTGAERSGAEPGSPGNKETHTTQQPVSPLTVSRTKLLPNRPVTASTSLFPCFNPSSARKKTWLEELNWAALKPWLTSKPLGEMFTSPLSDLFYFEVDKKYIYKSDGLARGASRWARACHVDRCCESR